MNEGTEAHSGAGIRPMRAQLVVVELVFEHVGL